MLCYLERLNPRHWLWLITVVFLARMAFIGFSGLDLIGDESYYWDWSRRPDWCYYSKPPMIAWLTALFTAIFGDSMPAVRAGAALLGSGFLYFFLLLAKSCYSDKTAAYALTLLLLTPANILSNFLMTIDAPFYFFWIVCLYFLHRALFKENKRSWYIAGIAAALAFLSKPTAIALPILLTAFLAVRAEFRAKLATALPAFLLPILISFIPLVYWNMQHDWIMLQHNQGHFGQDAGWNLTQRLDDFGYFLLLQLLLITPPLFVLLLIDHVRLTRSFNRLTAKESFLFVMGPAPLLAVLGLSLLQKSQGNWAIAFYFSGLVLLADRLANGHYRYWLKPVLITGMVILLATYSLPLSINALGLTDTPLDPTSRLRQWNKLANQVQSIRVQQFKQPANAFLLVHGHRHLVSELAFYLPDQPKVYHLPESGGIESQYQLWPGPTDRLGQDGLLISQLEPKPLSAKYGSAFSEMTYLNTIYALKNSPKERKYHVYLVKELISWPLNPIPQSAVVSGLN